jgi:divalent metal cation (Fe/Co/Zn/Cd) transporter
MSMSVEENSTRAEVLQRVLWIQTLTLLWMSVEAAVSLGAAWMARSPALLAFGGDSAVELLSAGVVFWRFYGARGSMNGEADPSTAWPTLAFASGGKNRSAPVGMTGGWGGGVMSELSRLRSGQVPLRPTKHLEERAGKIAGGLLFVLAVFVVTTSVLTLLGHVEARPSPIGIALLALAAMIMPWLAAQKRQLSSATASAALRADAAESAVCGYLALIALAGLVVNAAWKVSWADPVAALALLPLITREGWEVWKGKPCCD